MEQLKTSSDALQSLRALRGSDFSDSLFAEQNAHHMCMRDEKADSALKASSSETALGIGPARIWNEDEVDNTTVQESSQTSARHTRHLVGSVNEGAANDRAVNSHTDSSFHGATHGLSGNFPREFSQKLKESKEKDAPFVLMSPRNSALTILVLIFALCVSLTLLIIQGNNIASVSSAQTSAQSKNSSALKDLDGSKADRTQNSQDSAGQGASENSDSAGDDTSGSGVADSPSSAYSPATSPFPAQNGTAPQGGDQASNQSAAIEIDINTATAEQLETIPGIGPAMAKKILDYRSQHGKFSSIDSLMDISGIGAKTLEKMRPYVAIR